MTFDELFILIGEFYELDEDIYNRLELSYKTLCGKKGRMKSMIIEKK